MLDELKADYRELWLEAVFSQFGPRAGQVLVTNDLKTIVLSFPEMLADKDMSYNDIYEPRSDIRHLRALIYKIRAMEKSGSADEVSKLWKKVDEVEKRLLDPELKLYCGDVLIEFRPGVLKYESLRRLQQDPRLPQELNKVGNIRVVAGSLEFLAQSRK